MSSERELDEGIKSIKSAWRRERNARLNLEKMLEAENAKRVGGSAEEKTTARMKAENDELRKLLKEVLSLYGSCKQKGTTEELILCAHSFHELKNRAYKLGVYL